MDGWIDIYQAYLVTIHHVCVNIYIYMYTVSNHALAGELPFFHFYTVQSG